MSLSDTINSEWYDTNLLKVNLSLCIRGIMINNKKPITKWNPVRKPKSENTKIQRDLNIAEEYYYKKIIKPKTINLPVDAENIIEDT